MSELATNIVLHKWREIGFAWQGNAEFKRINALALTPANFLLSVNLEPEPLALCFAVQGAVSMPCQRCLDPMQCDIDFFREIALWQLPSQIDESDGILLEEVMQGDKLPLMQIIEDEILLELPHSPKHDDCDMAVQFDEDTASAQNPFAMLADLKL